MTISSDTITDNDINNKKRMITIAMNEKNSSENNGYNDTSVNVHAQL